MVYMCICVCAMGSLVFMFVLPVLQIVAFSAAEGSVTIN